MLMVKLLKSINVINVILLCVLLLKTIDVKSNIDVILLTHCTRVNCDVTDKSTRIY